MTWQSVENFKGHEYFFKAQYVWDFLTNFFLLVIRLVLCLLSSTVCQDFTIRQKVHPYLVSDLGVGTSYSSWAAGIPQFCFLLDKLQLVAVCPPFGLSDDGWLCPPMKRRIYFTGLITQCLWSCWAGPSCSPFLFILWFAQGVTDITAPFLKTPLAPRDLYLALFCPSKTSFWTTTEVFPMSLSQKVAFFVTSTLARTITSLFRPLIPWRGGNTHSLMQLILLGQWVYSRLYCLRHPFLGYAEITLCKRVN